MSSLPPKPPLVTSMLSAPDPGAFLGLDAADCGPESKGVVIPVPYEATTTYMGGTKAGPAAILKASRQVEYHDEWLEDEAQRFGVRTLAPVLSKEDPRKLADTLEALVGEYLDAQRFPLILGGEHSISLGSIRAALKRHPDLVILHLDAHPDLRDEYEGTHYGHGCVMRRVFDLGAKIHAFGIRAISPEERDFYLTQSTATCITARDLLPLTPLDRVDRILQDLPAGPIWLSWDIDGLDPSLVPCTGTPEPGGLDWFTVSELLLRLDAAGKHLVGAELVELSPQPNQHASDFACARLAHRMLLAGLRSLERRM
ncbi:MAG: agmatinase [Planctomycetota bacterium]|nr:agmatinase [Planctomycetota bacterium]MDA1112957.1 agmatinase [Planctomycetota bacterium]